MAPENFEEKRQYTKMDTAYRESAQAKPNKAENRHPKDDS